MRGTLIPSLQEMIAAKLVSHLAPASVEFVTEKETPWSSATFTGARQSYTLLVSGALAALAIAKLKRDIAHMEFDLRRHVVVDTDLRVGKTNWRISPPAMCLEIDILTVACDYRPAPSARRSAAISPPAIGVPVSFRSARRERAASSLDINPPIVPASA